MHLLAKRSFPNATLVSDRFHVQKRTSDAFQEIRMKDRRAAIDLENIEREIAKQNGLMFMPETLENGDSLKQLAARSRYLLFTISDNWTPTQRQSPEILFERDPRIKAAYKPSKDPAKIFARKTIKQIVYKEPCTMV
jgi:transposase